MCIYIKGTVARDFCPLLFSIKVAVTKGDIRFETADKVPTVLLNGLNFFWVVR
jgi:hypothetical protein